MTYQTFFKNKYCSASKIILTMIVGCLTLFSCSHQVNVMRSGFKSYPPREDSDSVVIYKKAQDIPIESEQIGRLEATCVKWMRNCDSISIFSSAEKKIKKAGGNALLMTKFEKPTFWNNSKLSLNGDVFLVHNFSSLPDTTLSLSKTGLDIFFEKHMYMGFGVGPETGISLMLPKLSFYNFQERNFFETYYGIEVSAWIIHAVTLSLDCLYGVKKNKFTFDTSVSVFWYPKQSIEGNEPLGAYFHSTLNPKIGIKFKGVWLKAGPSMHLYKDYPKDKDLLGFVDLVKIGNVYYNFEILIKV